MLFLKQLIKFKSKIVEFFLSEKTKNKGDDFNLFNSKRFVEGLFILLGLSILVFILQQNGLEESFPAEYSTIVCVLFLFLVKKNGNIPLLGNVLQIFFFCLITYQIMTLDKEIIAFFRWYIFFPLFSLMFINKKSTFIWSFIVITTNISLYYFPYNSTSMLSDPNFKFNFFEDSFLFFLLAIALVSLYHQRKEMLTKELIKDKKEMQAQSKKLTIYKDQLIEKNKDLETYAQIVSHDLKVPLRGIFSFSELLELNLKKENQIDKNNAIYLNQIKENTNHMNTLIVDILEYSAVINSENLSFTKVDIVSLINNLLNQFPKHKNQIQFQEKSVIEVSIIPTAIKQVFQNLISNSIKFSKKDAELEIKISIEQNVDQIIFKIMDNSIGIQKKDLTEVFKPFKKLNSNKNYQGSGIGLATCKKIIQKHGGTIWVSSELGVGSTFSFSISKLNTQ